MTDLFDTSQVRDEPAHWDALSERIAAHAAGATKGGGMGWLAQSPAGWLATSLLLAAALAFMLLPARPAAEGDLKAEWSRVLAPGDAVGKAIGLQDDPPAIGALLLGSQGRGSR
ncbi:MAG TPA: hypothetical protein VGQ69_09795 [Gemmatimonadales bacterium]|jgi:hypothetical protein|nr:hypothetical protein [Gemmatimonadales bacterium]